MEKSEAVYLASADRQLEHWLDGGAFDRDLVLHLLFHERIFVPDIFCFISSMLARHVLRRGPTLFEKALEEGRVVVHLRGGASSFSGALDVIRGQGIRGVHERAGEVAKRLDGTLSGRRFELAAGPNHSLGQSYKERLWELLRTPDPPLVGSRLDHAQDTMNNLWKCTEEYRFAVLDRALERSSERTGKDLRRGDIMWAVGRHIRLPEKDLPVDDVELLINSGRVKGPRQEHLLYFLRWMTDIYQSNHATSFGASPSFPAFESINGFTATSLRPSGPDEGDCLTRELEVRVQLPPLAALAAMEPWRLLDLRETWGRAYFTRLANWNALVSEAPASSLATIENAELDVIRELEAYALAICTDPTIPRRRLRRFLAQLHSCSNGPVRRLSQLSDVARPFGFNYAVAVKGVATALTMVADLARSPTEPAVASLRAPSRVTLVAPREI